MPRFFPKVLAPRSDPVLKEECANSTSISDIDVTWQLLNEMELNGEDVSMHEPSTSFIQLGKPPHTNRAVIFTNLDLAAPVFPMCDPHITEPRSPNDLTIPGKNVSEPVFLDAPNLPTNEETTNLFDFTDQLRDPGSDPLLTDTLPFPDRLGRCLNFWKSINAPIYIITALEEGIDIARASPRHRGPTAT